MKFLLITNNDSDGVGQHVVSLNSSLKELGHSSKTIVLHKSVKDNDIIKIKRSFVIRLFFYVLNFLKKDLNKLFSFGYSAVNYKKIEKYIKETDIIIIYSFFNILSFKTLKNIFESRKIVYLRPLDMEFAAGGCHVNLNSKGEVCENYKFDCNNCPQLNFLNVFNISNKILKKKKKIIEKYKPKIFVENTFTKDIYNESEVCKDVKAESIFLGVNQKRINFYSKQEAREKLKFSQNEKIMLFGSFNLDAYHKGGRILGEILKIFASNLYKEKKYRTNLNKIKLITFGRKNTFTIDIPEIEWVHLGIIRSDEKLNLLYRSSDILLSPSTACNGPHMVVEALANDLPVIAFNQGVAQDAVINGVNGYKVPCFDKEIFSNSISKALFSQELTDSKQQNNKLKLLFNSLYEAKTIIQHANKDAN